MTMTALSFTFAKRYGVLLIHIDEQVAKIMYQGEPTRDVFAELRRYFNKPLQLEQVSEQVFNAHLVKTYETDSTTAMQMVEDLGEALDLSDLMHHMPKPEDLLEKQDDAPIIRLLNALLSEAIKEGANTRGGSNTCRKIPSTRKRMVT